MTEPDEVESLLGAARQGDQRSIDRLFDACRNYLRVLARAQLQRDLAAKVDASDLVQQTLLEAHRNLSAFRGETEAEWLGWLRAILGRNVADCVRSFRDTEKRNLSRETRIRGTADSTGVGVFEPVDAGESPSQRLLREERELAVADALAKLSAEHQEVIVLRNLRQLPFDEVARRMDRSRPATQMLWMRALRKLKEILEHDP